MREWKETHRVPQASEQTSASGKRPLHTIIPGFITRAGVPVMAMGVMGGSMQAQGHVQMMMRLAAFS